jgi:aminopeptidase N
VRVFAGISVLRNRMDKPLVVSGFIIFIFISSLHAQHTGPEGRYPKFNHTDTLIGKVENDRGCYDVTSYDLDIQIYPGKKSLAGKVKIRFKGVLPEKKIRFDLYPNLKLDKVELNDSALAFERVDRAVYVKLEKAIVPGDTYQFNIAYHGSPAVAKRPPWEGGSVWKTDSLKNPWCGVACETEGASIWFPCKEHISDEPDSVEMRITVPKGLTAVSNGLMTNHESTDSTEIYSWSTHYPINPYNITWYVAKFAMFSDTAKTNYGTVRLDYYVLSNNLNRAKDHFKQVKNVIRIYSDLFGPYPWIKEDFKLVESPFAGMEHQTAIAYGSNYKNCWICNGDYIIIHETAHEWWGNAVSVSDFSDIWLQEGFATYAELLFVEKSTGRKSTDYLLNNDFRNVRNRRAVVGPADVCFWDYHDADVYYKGALILHTIRCIINNDKLFFDILRTFYREHALSTHPVTNDFKAVVERMTKKNWDNFFDVYLHKKKPPLLEYYYSMYNGKPDTLRQYLPGIPFVVAKWSRVNDEFAMPVVFEDPKTGKRFKIDVTAAPQIFYLEGSQFNPRIIFNPDNVLLDWDPWSSVIEEFEKMNGFKAVRDQWHEGTRDMETRFSPGILK